MARNDARGAMIGRSQDHSEPHRRPETVRGSSTEDRRDHRDQWIDPYDDAAREDRPFERESER